MEQTKNIVVIAAAALMAIVGAASFAEARGFHGGGFHGGGFHAGGFHGGGFRGGFRHASIGGWHGGPRVAGWRGRRVWHGAAWHGGRRVWRNGRWVAIGAFPAFYGGYYYGGYGGGCGWLYRRASVTGSSYWWRRYQACVGSY
ncbi:hypothetical protein [Hyphomicrobium sp.]|uniref:hypothetical protein n=1 Tax=Hyphomicrobium sp. TaxID=82 RepID=UPI002E311199|nr:hypothetical protein [Hyphomicrobium sp.]HEX2843188.1 hypothetical protein [Hyphomicrobium sp.]